MPVAAARFSERFGVFGEGVQLSPRYAQAIVDNLWMNFAVGTLQRARTQEIRGLQRGAFGYNESPTSSCHTFCWKARLHFWTCLFFAYGPALRAFKSLREMSLQRNG